MNFFTKNKMLFWCVVILVLINITTLTFLWLGRPTVSKAIENGGVPDGQAIMTERLSLSDEQAVELQRIRDQHFTRTRPLQDEMHQIRLDLLNELFDDQPEEAKINALFSQLEDEQEQFERNLYRHFQELKEICTPEQGVKLKTMLRELIERTRAREPQHRPRGRPQGMPPAHSPMSPQR